ncbi:MAG: alpha-glucuronidase family glycosyl hydrolase [Prolixibacteraceae bacterium]|nr:alpha-glucuronidase family glycosyl hydrolase [Prolixibacteraceae bacterium]
MKPILVLVLSILIPIFIFAEDGSELWLRYKALPVALSKEYSQQLQFITFETNSLTRKIAGAELEKALKGMLGRVLSKSRKIQEKTIIIGTLEDKSVRQFISEDTLCMCGDEGFILKSVDFKGDKILLLAANQDVGLLYGVFELIRQIQQGHQLSNLNLKEKPSYNRRILNHWDNLDGTVERGYAGHSIWKWEELPEKISPKYEFYARANASIGINGTVLNNVNASPQILSDEYLRKVKVLADIFRPYGIRVYLAVNFSSPAKLGGLPTSDPLDEKVQDWWKKKADEIYNLIPDFGGFLVKANSEGLPGPQDYGRTHADGANMLADALAPHNGIVMWRAFVYHPDGDDRAKQAYKEFTPLDGQFRSNVIIQVKNGPIDFQPREPFSPLFGAMKNTNLMPEFQITKEYLGMNNHLAYLGPLFEECLDADTYVLGKNSTVARVTDGSLFRNKVTAIAGVANIGEDVNWCGHQFNQANWYVFGRLAWNNKLSSGEIATEWIEQTFSRDPQFVSEVGSMMMQSREAVVNYMTPMGLHHLMGWDHHYGPEPWCAIPNARPDWMPSYYHKADSAGIGFDRTSTGSNAVGQYAEPLRSLYENVATCPEIYLLWFHHLSWNYILPNGNNLWDELCYKYSSGVNSVKSFQKTWDNQEGKIDEERFREVQQKLAIQEKEAVWWRDACLLYFQTFSNKPIPEKLDRPIHRLDELKKQKFNLKNHN